MQQAEQTLWVALAGRTEAVPALFRPNAHSLNEALTLPLNAIEESLLPQPEPSLAEQSQAESKDQSFHPSGMPPGSRKTSPAQRKFFSSCVMAVVTKIALKDGLVTTMAAGRLRNFGGPPPNPQPDLCGWQSPGSYRVSSPVKPVLRNSAVVAV